MFADIRISERILIACRGECSFAVEAHFIRNRHSIRNGNSLPRYRGIIIVHGHVQIFRNIELTRSLWFIDLERKSFVFPNQRVGGRAALQRIAVDRDRAVICSFRTDGNGSIEILRSLREDIGSCRLCRGYRDCIEIIAATVNQRKIVDKRCSIRLMVRNSEIDRSAIEDINIGIGIVIIIIIIMIIVFDGQDSAMDSSIVNRQFSAGFDRGGVRRPGDIQPPAGVDRGGVYRSAVDPHVGADRGGVRRPAAVNRQPPPGVERGGVRCAAAVNMQTPPGVDRGGVRRAAAVNRKISLGIDRGFSCRCSGMYCGIVIIQNQSAETVGNKCKSFILDIIKISINTSPIFFDFQRRSAGFDKQPSAGVDYDVISCSAAQDIHIIIVVDRESGKKGIFHEHRGSGRFSLNVCIRSNRDQQFSPI